MHYRLLICLCLFALLPLGLSGQNENVASYDLRDGVAIAAGQTSDGAVTFAGTYSHHGTQYGLNMKVDGVITVTVNGSATVRFLGSQYSGLNMIGTAAATGDLGTQNTKVVADLSDTYAFTYSGAATTLTFTLAAGSGNDLYLPLIEVIPAQAGMSFTEAKENIIYNFDFRDGSIIPTDTDGQSGLSVGLVDVVVGCCNAYGYNGGQHGSILKTGNQLKFKVAGNTRLKIGGSIFSGGNISVSSEMGIFDVLTQSATTAGNFGNDGSTVDFLYVGDAGVVTLDFTATNYVPYVELVPVPYEVTLTPFVQKSGTINVNGTAISLQSGADASSNATVSLSEGTVISTTATESSVLINLAGEALGFYTPTFSGDIDTVVVAGDSLFVTFADAENSDPGSFLIGVKDNSVIVEAEPGAVYTYNFANGTELPQISYNALRYGIYVSNDGILTINSNTDLPAGQFGYHDASHGGVFFPGNSFDIIVAGDAIITFIVDQYGVANDAVFELTDSEGTVLGSIAAQNIDAAVDGVPSSFAYTGNAGVVTATLVSTGFPTAEIYLHGLNVENAAELVAGNGKADVWDFGAEQLDTADYNNMLNVEVINGWYDSAIVPGSAGNVLPSFSEGVLSWVGGGNDRLRTTNTELTRFDANLSNSLGTTGRVYVNGTAAVGRFMSLNLNADDEVTLITKTDAGGKLNFQYVPNPEGQTDIVEMTSDPVEITFVAKEAGIYHIFDTEGKPSYFRIIRNDADYVTVTGNIDITAATDIPSDYQLVFTNEAGKEFRTSGAGSIYSLRLPGGYTYEVSLDGANRFFISSETTLAVSEENSVLDVVINSAELYSMSGTVVGLGDQLGNATLSFTAVEPRVFVPVPMVNTEDGTYSVLLEPNVHYVVSAEGVNDYFIPQDTVLLAADADQNIVFVAKPVYAVAITAPALTAEQIDSLNLTFSNLNEEGYSYTFNSVGDVALRSGTYSVKATGLDYFPVELALTSNLLVAGVETSKTLDFVPVHVWTFDDRNIESGEMAYKGLRFDSIVRSEANRGHLLTKEGAVVRVPVSPGENVKISYYYTASFVVAGGDTIVTNTLSTSVRESVVYSYPADTAGYVDITFGGAGAVTTYIFEIETFASVDYQETLTVGIDKDFQIINEALAAVRKMEREADQRVTILVDPGNYEEMLDIDVPNVTLKNAAATPSIELRNQGVDIDENAVRVTSYYGHGYNYFSMGDNQRWNADILRVNRENGYLSYENRGAGTTNNSFWNTTVLVTADGFEAEDIIFENSFNQYISRKEAEDVVVEWEVGGRGERPTDINNTAVQSRDFVERAAAIAVANNADQIILNKCRVVGRQDAFYGGRDSRVVMYKGSAMGAVDYIFGGMTAVFYKTELAMNTSDVSSDQTYITAAQQSGGRGYLMNQCIVTSAVPGSETASSTRSKPGYYGRPWEATTSEVVFYNTTIETSDYPTSNGLSLIEPVGWRNTLGGESNQMYEFGTVELSGADNLNFRANWSTLLTEPVLNDGTPITNFNFTKGDDGWDPLPGLIENDPVATRNNYPVSAVEVYSGDDTVFIRNVKSRTSVRVYNVAGAQVQAFDTSVDTSIRLDDGIWIIVADAADGRKAVKVFTHR